MGDMIQETAKTSERLTDKLRRMTLEIVVNPKEYEKYKEDLVLIHGIELEYKDEILRVSAPVLIPHRKDCYTDYLYKPLHTAFRNWCMQRAEEKLEKARNIRAVLLTALYNSVNTINSYYGNRYHFHLAEETRREMEETD